MKKGFSLSEVLITLSIIGVVAAMTLPSVINKTQLFILKNQYKKVYNNYSNALQKYIADNGLPDCYYGTSRAEDNRSNCSSFYDEFMTKYLKSVKYCENNALTNGCVPKYSKYADTDGCMGFKENYINNKDKVWVLNDGSIHISYMQKTYSIFAVDINGLKGPNKRGYDLFSFAIEKKGDTAILSAGSCVPSEEGGINPYNDFRKIYE